MVTVHRTPAPARRVPPWTPASHVVVGRTVTRAADPAAAFRLVRAGLEQ
ncbi:hypothetical protein [Streptomyces stackebrandtii]|nr:hypothetical protein [Streptomyces sp. DSM 40976]